MVQCVGGVGGGGSGIRWVCSGGGVGMEWGWVGVEWEWIVHELGWGFTRAHT